MSPALARALARTESASPAPAESPARGWVAAALVRLGLSIDAGPERDER